MNLYRTYLMAALSLGFVDHVYRTVGKWSSQLYGESPKKGDAAWTASEELVKNHGFHKCPSCTWVTQEKDEHLVPGMWCYDEDFLHRNGVYPNDEIDGVPAHNLFPQRTEEERRQEEINFYGYDWRIPWDKQPDGVSAFLATPDSVMDRMFRS